MSYVLPVPTLIDWQWINSFQQRSSCVVGFLSPPAVDSHCDDVGIYMSFPLLQVIRLERFLCPVYLIK